MVQEINQVVLIDS